MEAYLLDVLNLLLRWLHMIAGIAWIGASFYFVMLDSSLKSAKKPEDEQRGVFGELWAVHGGGFYQSQKFLTGPQGEPLSQDLHWSKWEAYTTWLSGFSLLVLIYWLGADIYLIDASVMALSSTTAIMISCAFLLGGWLIYHLLCQSPLAKNDNLLAAILLVLVCVSAWALCNIFSGRGAYMMFGAMLGTIMVANVFFVIIPGQKKMVAAIRAGEEVDPQHGISGKQRSVHNTYFTLPVLFTMISNHYALSYGHKYNWLILIGITLVGALIRVFFVSRHGSGKPAYAALAVALALLVIGIFMLAPSKQSTVANQQQVSMLQVQEVINARCTGCHSAAPTQAGFAAAPKGVAYDTVAQIEAQMEQIHQQAVVTKVMPIGNLTAMTDAERKLLADWYAQIKPSN